MADGAKTNGSAGDPVDLTSLTIEERIPLMEQALRVLGGRILQLEIALGQHLITLQGLRREALAQEAPTKPARGGLFAEGIE